MSSSGHLSVVVHADRIQVHDYDIETLRRLTEAGGVLYWDNSGVVGKVPNAVLRNLIEALDAWDRLRERHIVSTLPRDLGVLWWEQTVTPQDSSALERARRLPYRSPQQYQPRSTSAD